MYSIFQDTFKNITILWKLRLFKKLNYDRFSKNIEIIYLYITLHQLVFILHEFRKSTFKFIQLT